MPLPEKLKSLIPTYDADAEKARIMAQFDPAELDEIELFGARIMVAKWIRQTAGSIQLAEQTKKEDMYQGKVGLVIKVGPVAFTDDANHNWHGQFAQPGDWVVYGYADGHDFDFSIRGTFERVPCKILDESNIQMIVNRPDFAY